MNRTVAGLTAAVIILAAALAAVLLLPHAAPKPPVPTTSTTTSTTSTTTSTTSTTTTSTSTTSTTTSTTSTTTASTTTATVVPVSCSGASASLNAEYVITLNPNVTPSLNLTLYAYFYFFYVPFGSTGTILLNVKANATVQVQLYRVEVDTTTLINPFRPGNTYNYANNSLSAGVYELYIGPQFFNGSVKVTQTGSVSYTKPSACSYSTSYSGKGVIYPIGTNNPNLTTSLFFYVYVPPWATGQLSVSVKANTTEVEAQLYPAPVYYNTSAGFPIIYKMGSSFTSNATLTPGIYELFIIDNGGAPASVQFTANFSYTPSANQ